MTGDFSCNGTPAITGTGVMFYFTNGATWNCAGNDNISLSALTSGTYKDMLSIKTRPIQLTPASEGMWGVPTMASSIFQRLSRLFTGTRGPYQQRLSCWPNDRPLHGRHNLCGGAFSLAIQSFTWVALRAARSPAAGVHSWERDSGGIVMSSKPPLVFEQPGTGIRQSAPPDPRPEGGSCVLQTVKLYSRWLC